MNRNPFFLKLSGWLKTLLGLVLVVVLGATLSIFLNLKTAKTEAPSQAPKHSSITQQNTPTSSLLSQADPTEGWKTYRNEHYGFDLVYPSSLAITYETNDSVIWQYPQDTGYESPRLILRVEKKDGDKIDLDSYLNERYEGVRRITIERDGREISAVQELGLSKRTKLGLDYRYNKLVNLEDGSDTEEIYLVIHHNIVSLSSRLNPQIFSIVIESIRLANLAK